MPSTFSFRRRCTSRPVIHTRHVVQPFFHLLIVYSLKLYYCLRAGSIVILLPHILPLLIFMTLFERAPWSFFLGFIELHRLPKLWKMIWQVFHAVLEFFHGFQILAWNNTKLSSFLWFHNVLHWTNIRMKLTVPIPFSFYWERKKLSRRQVVRLVKVTARHSHRSSRSCRCSVSHIDRWGRPWRPMPIGPPFMTLNVFYAATH